MFQSVGEEGPLVPLASAAEACKACGIRLASLNSFFALQLRVGAASSIRQSNGLLIRRLKVRFLRRSPRETGPGCDTPAFFVKRG